MLYDKHYNDVFVPECKDGPTWGRNHSRLDAWVLKRSYSNFEMIGYEIKISKSDFRSDIKYVNYLPMCNTLYFICPWNMIQVSEIPLEVGLIYVSKNEGRLITRKKAVYRDIAIPTDTLIYILMSRSQIVDNTDKTSTREYWKNFVEKKNEFHDIGQRASKKIRQLISEKIDVVDEENKELKHEHEVVLNRIKSFELFERLLNENGIRTNGYDFKLFKERNIGATVQMLCGDKSKEVISYLNNIERGIDNIKQVLNIEDDTPIK